MFQALDATLRAVLADAPRPDAVRNAAIGFDTPDRDFQPQHASVNLFLHEVSETGPSGTMPRPASAPGRSLRAHHRSCGSTAPTWSTAWSVNRPA